MLILNIHQNNNLGLALNQDDLHDYKLKSAKDLLENSLYLLGKIISEF